MRKRAKASRHTAMAPAYGRYVVELPVDGRPVTQGMKLTRAKCDQVNAVERNKALAWVDQNVRVPLTPPQKVGIASFCPYNIGPGKCFPSTFYRKLNAGDRKGACAEIRRWILMAEKIAACVRTIVTAGLSS